MRKILASLIVCSLGVSGASIGGEAGAVLGDRTMWRAHFTFHTEASREYPNGEYRSPLPAAGWAAPEFDDSGWARWRIGVRHGRYYAYGIMEDGALSHATHLVCLRGRFTVTDPASAGLVLDLSYRGGAAVYVNGKELKRQHLPAGAGLDAQAEAYPKEAWYQPNGQPLRTVGSALGTTYKANVEARIRRIEKVAVPAEMLRKGVNVLAVEIHASPYEEKVRQSNNSNNPCLWSPCGPISLSLSGGPGAAVNNGRPKGIQVWTAGADVRPERSDYADPHEGLLPIRLSGARNGRFCGQAVVGSDATVAGLKAVMSELKHADGKSAIPASAVEVLYGYWRDGRYGAAFVSAPTRSSHYLDPLSGQAPAEVAVPKEASDPDAGAVQPVWIKVQVPADAVAGEYRGTLWVTAGGQKTDVPVLLRVSAWKLPDPKGYESLAGLIQSPDSVAIHYKVPLWSDQHFKLMEKSYELIGQAGGKFVWLPLMTRTNLGNTETIVRWVKTGDNGGAKYKPDFAVFDRYMDMVQKHLRPGAVCLFVYDRYTDYAGRSQATPERLATRGAEWKHRGMPGTNAWKISVLDPKTGQVTEELAPSFRKSVYDEKLHKVTEEQMLAENRGFYEEVLKETHSRLEKRGLGKAVMLGIEEDVGAKESTRKFLGELLPGVKWVRMCHPMDDDASQYGYRSAVYLPGMPPPMPWDKNRTPGWQFELLGGIFPRTGGVTYNYVSATSDPGLYRVLTEACQLTAMTRRHFPLKGLARGGADFWPVLNPETKPLRVNRSYTVCARFPETCWDQLNMDRSIESMLAPGPDGAVPTMRFESYREGIQECEARIFIEKAIVGGKLDAATTKKCQELLDERHSLIRAACIGGGDGGFVWYAASGSHGLAARLFDCAAEVAAKTGGK